MVLIYTHKITSRIKYIFKHVFTSFFKMEVNFTSDEKKFTNYQGYKMSYTLAPLADEFFFESCHLLFETKIEKDLDIEEGERFLFFSKLHKNACLDLIFLLQVFI
jgi:hypothetical protein